MKKTLFLLIVIFICCTKQDSKIGQEMLIKYYALNISAQKDSEKIILRKNAIHSCLDFIYEYKYFKEDNDTLSIKKNSVFLNSIKLSFIAEKVFLYNDKKYTIKKYVSDNIITNTDVYINESDGVILTNTSGNMSYIINEYYPNNNIKGIHERIIRDSIFFNK